ncbi:MAG: hypothetical protein KDC49_08730 [Saprospiraceae bacterium]|nr:hypothetical protein [Saprospiraceae bacterium]
MNLIPTALLLMSLMASCQNNDYKNYENEDEFVSNEMDDKDLDDEVGQNHLTASTGKYDHPMNQPTNNDRYKRIVNNGVVITFPANWNFTSGGKLSGPHHASAIWSTEEVRNFASFEQMLQYHVFPKLQSMGCVLHDVSYNAAISQNLLTQMNRLPKAMERHDYAASYIIKCSIQNKPVALICNLQAFASPYSNFQMIEYVQIASDANQIDQTLAEVINTCATWHYTPENIQQQTIAMNNSAKNMLSSQKIINQNYQAANQAISSIGQTNARSFDRMNTQILEGIRETEHITNPWSGSQMEVSAGDGRIFIDRDGNAFRTNDQFYQPGSDLENGHLFREADGNN